MRNINEAGVILSRELGHAKRDHEMSLASKIKQNAKAFDRYSKNKRLT